MTSEDELKADARDSADAQKVGLEIALPDPNERLKVLVLLSTTCKIMATLKDNDIRRIAIKEVRIFLKNFEEAINKIEKEP
jgi:hypothetical protein